MVLLVFGFIGFQALASFDSLGTSGFGIQPIGYECTLPSAEPGLDWFGRFGVFPLVVAVFLLLLALLSHSNDCAVASR